MRQREQQMQSPSNRNVFVVLGRSHGSQYGQSTVGEGRMVEKVGKVASTQTIWSL